MKTKMQSVRIFCIIFIVFANTNTLKAQAFDISVSLQPGIMHVAIDNEAHKITSVPSSFAFRGGAEGTYYFNKTWGARLGVDLLTSKYYEVFGVAVFSEEGEFIETRSGKYAIPIYYLSVPIQAVYKKPLKNIDIEFMVGMRYHSYVGSKDYDMNKAKKYPWYKKSYFSIDLGVEFNKEISEKLAVSIGITTDIPMSDFLEKEDGFAILQNKSRLWKVFVPIKLTYHLKM